VGGGEGSGPPPERGKDGESAPGDARLEARLLGGRAALYSRDLGLSDVRAEANSVLSQPPA